MTTMCSSAAALDLDFSFSSSSAYGAILAEIRHHQSATLVATTTRMAMMVMMKGTMRWSKPTAIGVESQQRRSSLRWGFAACWQTGLRKSGRVVSMRSFGD